MIRSLFLSLLLISFLPHLGKAQNLETQLLSTPVDQLIQEARQLGDAKRGGVAFFQVYLSCAKCHSVGDKENPLGPDLTQLGDKATDQYLLESVLNPSKVIKKGFDAVTLVTVEGKQVAGLIESQSDDLIVLNDVSRPGVELKFAAEDVDEIIVSKTLKTFTSTPLRRG